MAIAAKQSNSARSIPDYITVQDLADRASLPQSSIRQWIREGKLRGFKVGRNVRIRVEDAEALFKEIGA